MTYLKSLIVFALFSSVLFNPARSFAQIDPHRPSQPVAPKLPVSLILDQPDTESEPHLPQQESISQPIPSPKESTFPDHRDAILLSRGPQPDNTRLKDTSNQSKHIKE